MHNINVQKPDNKNIQRSDVMI